MRQTATKVGALTPWVSLALLLAIATAPTAAPADEGRLRRVTAEELKAVLRPGTQPRLIHVWASWCVPCVAEWPLLAKSLRRLAGRPLEIVTVALEEDPSGDAAGKILAGLDALPGRSLVAPIEDSFPVVHTLDPDWDGSLPATVLIDGSGHVAHAQYGMTQLRSLEEAIDRIAPVSKRKESNR